MFEQSKWIWLNDKAEINSYGEFVVEIEKSNKSTVCNLSCDGDYTLFVNERYVASNQYGDYEHYKVYDTIDLTQYLAEGKNVVKFLVWHFGKGTMRYIEAKAGLIFEIVQDGKVVAQSDAKILCRKSPTYRSGYNKEISPQLGFTFLYDATKEGQQNGFYSVVEVEKKCTFYPRPIKKQDIGEPCVSNILKNDGNYYLIDLGKETVGLPVLKFYSSTEQKIRVDFGEDLQNGHVRRIIGTRDFSFDYVAKIGDNNYVNYMLRLGCRYLEVYAEQPITVEYIGLLPQTYPVETIDYKLNDELDQKIFNLCIDTLKLCMMEHYVDCPWREQCFYAFDSRNQMLSGYYAFKGGNKEYVRANLKLMSMDRREDNMFSICAPCGWDLTIPSFSLYYYLAVREYLEHTGDLTLGEEVYDKLNSVIQVFVNNRKNGLVCKFKGANNWNFYDWTEYMEGALHGEEESVPDVMINLLFILALENLKIIESTLSKDFKYEEILSETKLKTRDAFFNEENGLFSMTIGGNEYTDLANSLAVILGLIGQEEREKISLALTSGDLTECSLSMKTFKYDALLTVDEEKWLPYVFSEIRKDYTKMLDAGATATWETIDGAKAFDNAGSLCHGWTAIPIYYYSKYLLLKN